MLLLASLDVVLSVVGKVLLAILILLFMITVHEFGHYIAGKLLGFQINEFAIGMGPKIFRKQLKSGEYFSIRIFPLGGYCAFEGEDEGDNTNDKAFNNHKPWKRIIVLISGALFNFISAILISLIAFSCFSETVLVVDDVFDDSANVSTFNTSNGLMQGDIIYSIDGKKIYLTVDSSSYISKADDTMSVIVLRKDEKGKFNKVEITVNKGNYTYVDEDGNIHQNYGWGILQKYQKHTFGFKEAVVRSLPYCLRTGSYILETLGGIFTGRVGVNDLGGPITTIDVTTQIISTGLGNTLFLIIMISVNLAVFNLLPLPALDGGRVVFVIIEWIIKKPVNRKIEAIVHAVGLILLLGLVILLDAIRYLL